MPKISDLIKAAKEQSQRVEALKNKSQLTFNYAKHVEKRTDAMRSDLEGLAEELAVAYEENKALADTSGTALQAQVLKYLDTEIANLAELDKARTKDGAPWLPFQISSQKLSFTLPNIREQLSGAENESAVVRLTAGEFKPDPSFADTYPRLRTGTFFGSNCATYEAGKRFCVRFATSDKSIADYNDTSIAHLSPCSVLPECFVTSGSKFFAKVKGVKFFGFYHAGYAFGGQRGEPKQFEMGPEDCSSLLANLLHQTANPGSEYKAAPIQTSTVHQLYAWRDRQSNSKMFIDRSKDAYSLYIVKYWDSILAPETPSSDSVQAGDIYLLRTAAKAKGDFDLHATGGGHTGIVIGEDPNDPTSVSIFECARNLESEKIDLQHPEKSVWGVGGAGVGSFSKRYDEQTDDRIQRNMFLRPAPGFGV